ncbi:MAG: hypothetical protein ACJA1O_000078 [Spirosomataceae bacterium]
MPELRIPAVHYCQSEVLEDNQLELRVPAITLYGALRAERRPEPQCDKVPCQSEQTLPELRILAVHYYQSEVLEDNQLELRVPAITLYGALRVERRPGNLRETVVQCQSETPRPGRVKRGNSKTVNWEI